jgi:uncharacterized SAM-binding protein YcdF (DUF218 family)
MTNTYIILGGGITKDNILPEWCIDRCNYVIQKYNEHKVMNIICTSGGSYHNPNPLNDTGFTIHECDTLCEYLIKKGIPSEIIFKEWTSYDTIGNAYFSKLLLIDTYTWYDMVIVTSDFHFERSKNIFEYIFRDDKYKLKYVSCSYNGNHPYLKNRIKKEEKSLEDFKKTCIIFKDNFHDFIYKKHQCYVSKPNEKIIQSKYLYN